MKTYSFGGLIIGETARVVGTISQSETLSTGLAASAGVCDIAEVRLDLIGVDTPGWLSKAGAIETAGRPVILTLRLQDEGGRWDKPDADRATILAEAIGALSTIDIEYRSTLRRDLCALAEDQGKGIIVSYHCFESTPSAAELEAIVAEIISLPAAIPKITTMVTSNQDIASLESLLHLDVERPVCVMGMGDAGTSTRVEFARQGSCLTYGYLDKAIAPGQIPSSELVHCLTHE